MHDRTAAATRCPQCSAGVRPGAPWCTQCYAPTGAPRSAVTGAVTGAGAPASAPTGAAARPVAAPAAGPAAAPAAAVAATWPCEACAHPNGLSLAACAACGTPFLAAVREQRPTVVLPGVGDVLALSPVRRVGLAVAAVVVFVVVAALVALVLA